MEKMSANADLEEALELLEACRGCDLWYDAWPSFGEGKEVHGVKITMETSVAEVVDAFLKKHNRVAPFA